MNIGMIDTLEIAFDVSNYNTVFKEWILDLERNKSISQYNRNIATAKNAEIELNNLYYEILPNGSSNHAYILHGEFFEIKFAKARSLNNNFYPIVFRAKSEGLWSNSADIVCADMFKIIRSINKDYDMEIQERIKRVDLCCHTNEFSLNYNSLEEFQGRYISNDIRRSNSTIETYALGARSNPVFCRIYNKSKEVISKNNKLWFFDIWLKNGLTGSDVWNIEFELKRALLKEVGIKTVYDLFTNIKSLWKYCTCNWLQHKKLTNTRIERCPVSEQWKKIQSAFDHYEGKSYISREKQYAKNAKGLVPTIIGYATSFGASFDDMDIKTALNEIYRQGKDYLNQKNTDYESEIERKRRKRREVAK